MNRPQSLPPTPSCGNSNRQLLDVLNPTHTDIQKVLTLSWSFLNRCLSSSASSSKEEARTVSTIIHKIMCSFTQLNTLATDFCAPFLEFTSTHPDPLSIVQAIQEAAFSNLDDIHPFHRNANQVMAKSWKNLRHLLETSPPLPRRS